MREKSAYKGVQHARGSRWLATLVVEGKQLQRGPFPLQGQAVMARRLMVEAKDRGEDIPTTAALRELVKDAPSIGDEVYEPSMRERLAQAR